MVEEVKLLGMWASPYTRRIELALKQKGIEYEYMEQDVKNKSPLLLYYNPVHKKVPVLVHNGKPVAESLIILEYIDETWKDNPLLPQDPTDRALARLWARFIDEKLSIAVGKVFVGEEREKALEEYLQLLKKLENELKEDFFGGETLGYLDIAAMTIPFWFSLVQEVVGGEQVTEQKFPILYKWICKLHDMDVVNECLPPKEKLLAHIRAQVEALQSPPK